MKPLSILITVALASASCPTLADEMNKVPSCYAANKMEVTPPVLQKEVFILLDETTVLDDRLKASLASATRSLVNPGSRFSVLGFSAFAQGRYLDRIAAGTLELPVPQNTRSSISVKVLKKFDECMAGQANYGLNLAFQAEKKVLDQAATDLTKSDVIASLTEVSHLVKASSAPRRIVLIVSDMLENSSISSFYAKNTVRKLEPEKEFATVAREKMFGDFGGAEVYVMGAGLVPEKKESVYRDPKTVNALKTFWQGYFEKSNAKLIEFGAPELLSPPH